MRREPVASANAPPIGVSCAIAVVAPPTPADTLRPSVSFATPQTGATVSGTVPIAVQASDNVGVTQVQFFVDGTLVTTDTASPYTSTWDTTQATAASHTLTAKAFDAAGNTAEATISVTVATARPNPPPPGTIFYLPDHLGSSTVMTDHMGQVIQRLSYRPFGGFAGPAPGASVASAVPSDGAAIHHYFTPTPIDVIAAKNPSGWLRQGVSPRSIGTTGQLVQGFTGKELDTSTDLYYFGARYYDSALGRFTQPDPLLNPRDPQDGPYTYARNNPLRLIDPTGLSFQSNLGSGWGVGGFGTGLGDFVSGSLNQAWQNLTGWASQTWQGATNWATQTAQSLNQTVTSAMQSFQSGVHQFSAFAGSPLGQTAFGVTGIFWEPADWLAVGAAWRQGNASPLDLLALAPGLSYGMVRGLRALDEVGGGLRAMGQMDSALIRASEAAAKVTIPEARLAHILERHAFDTTALNVGRFAQGIDVPHVIVQAVRSDASLIRPNALGRAGYIFEHTFSFPIGVTRYQQSTNTLVVIVRENGQVLTAFPR